MSSRESLLYKIVLTVKSSVPYPKLYGRHIPDEPPFAIHGFFFCIDGKEKVIPPSKHADGVVYDHECKELEDVENPIVTGFVSGKHLFHEVSNKFWKQPATEYIPKEEDLYATMCQLWPGLSKFSSEKTWDYQVVKHKYGIDACTPKYYLTIATHYGKFCMDLIMQGLRQQQLYSFGTGDKFFCKEFQKWVNSIFEVKVDCRFRKLDRDNKHSDFGLLKIGILGRLYLDNYEWDPVNLIVAKDNVREDEKINDLSQFYLRNLSENKSQKKQRLRGHQNQNPSQKKQRRH